MLKGYYPIFNVVAAMRKKILKFKILFNLLLFGK